MKKIIIFLFSFIFCWSVYAQTDVTTFMGIPVDGSRSNMIKQLKKKGFKTKKIGKHEILQGMFNNHCVNVIIVDNNKNVYRVIVSSPLPGSAINAKNYFNNLCLQFKNNENYLEMKNDWSIPDDEDISYEIRYKGKCYQGLFFQKPNDESLEKLQVIVMNTILNKTLAGELSGFSEEEIANEIDKEYEKELVKFCENKRVWFQIMERDGEYGVVIYYENVLNLNDGVDL